MTDEPDLPTAEDIAETRGGPPYFRRPVPFGDEPPAPLYAISKSGLDEIESFLREPALKSIAAGLPETEGLLGAIRCARENGPIPEFFLSPPEAAESLEENRAAALARLQRQSDTAEKQRDFLIGQTSSLITRLAGAHVTAGLIDMAAAEGFAQKEVMPINAMLAQIAAANQARGE